MRKVVRCEMCEEQHLVVLDFDWTVMPYLLPLLRCLCAAELMVTREACTADITNDTRWVRSAAGHRLQQRR